MTSIDHIISMNESDIYGRIKPSELFRLAIDCSMDATTREGASNERMHDVFHAAWMVARVRVRQFMPLSTEDAIQFSATPRAIDGGSYVRCVDIFKNGEKAARCDMVFMVVDINTRKIIRPRDIDGNWYVPPAETPAAEIRRLRFRGEGVPVMELVVRGYDCDGNGHLTSHRYIDYICESSGYWGSGPKLPAEYQVEFMSECRPGETIAIESSADGDKLMLRGMKADGHAAFCASCVWE